MRALVHGDDGGPVRPALIATFWFGIQLVWGAILAVSLQARSVELAPFAGVAAYSTIAAVGALIAAATQVVVGPLADRRRAAVGHRREFFLAGTIVSIIAVIGFYAAPSFGLLLAAFIVLQMAMNVAMGPYQAVIPDYVEPDRSGRASAWMAIFQSSGNAAGLVIAGFIANQMLVGFILAMTLTATYSITDAHLRWRKARAETLVPVRIDRHFRTLLASRGAINVGFYTLLGFLFFYVQNSLRAADVRMTTAMLFLTFTLCGIAGAIGAARPVDRRDKRVIVAIANAVVACSLIALALTSSLPVAYAAAALAGAAWGAFFTADWALACTILPAGAMASAMGIWNVAAALPQVIAPLLTGPLVTLADAHQPGLGPRLAIALAVVEFTLGAAWLWRLPGSVTNPTGPQRGSRSSGISGATRL